MKGIFSTLIFVIVVFLVQNVLANGTDNTAPIDLSTTAPSPYTDDQPSESHSDTDLVEPIPERKSQSSIESTSKVDANSKSEAPNKNYDISANKFRKLKLQCDSFDKPEGNSLGKITLGKKIWTEAYNTGWYRIYRKDGPAYAKKECF